MKTTILFEEHKKLGAKIGAFANWQMPIQYTSIIEEHNWTRTNASIFDICHMGEFMIYGDLEKSNLDKICSRKLSSMKNNSCKYGFMLNEKAGIIDDIVVYKLEKNKWMLIVNAANIEKDEKHLRENFSKYAVLENISDKTGKLDIQGPLSKDVMKKYFGERIENIRYYQLDQFQIENENIIVGCTGYTGEIGYEIYASLEKTKFLWDLLLQDERVKPAGLGARDTLRLEMGYCLYGQDINEETNPIEANLEKFVDYNKEFIGKKSLVELKKKGIEKNLVGIITNFSRSPRHDYKIYLDQQEIGVITSGTFSPSLRTGIGLGYVKIGYDNLNTKVFIGENKISGIITSKPFYSKVLM